MSTDTLPQSERAPLGLPPGSIRAILSLGIAGSFWLYLSLPKADHVPLYLFFLSSVLLLFFASHGRTISAPAARHPWHLPKGTFRLLIIAGTIAVIVYQYMQDPQEIARRLKPNVTELESWTLYFGATLGGFFLGWLLAHGPWSKLAAFQDLMAWLAVIALLMMLAETFWKVFIDAKGIVGDRPIWETTLVAVISCYFGTRS